MNEIKTDISLPGQKKRGRKAKRKGRVAHSFTEYEIAMIRALNLSDSKLAEMYKTSRQTINNIKRGITHNGKTLGRPPKE